MRYKLTFALVASLTSTAFAEFKAPLPEFKNEKQLAEWRAEKASEATDKGYTAEETPFYTGKPYLASSGSYAFKYRSYSPELARWTSEDPSGFPDGANGSIYAPCPTIDLDVAGLLKWSTLVNTNTKVRWYHGNPAQPQNMRSLISDLWTVQTNDGSATIELFKNTAAFEGSIAGLNYIFNCHGYTFANSEYWIGSGVEAILKGDNYKLITGSDKTGARVASWGGDVHTAKVNSVSSGNVSSVTGKLGAEFILTSSPGGQGYGTDIKYYE
jgi:RHS repeat-associated protein